MSDTFDCKPSGSPVHGISQAIILEWVTISFSITKLKKQTNKQTKNKKQMQLSVKYSSVQLSCQMNESQIKYMKEHLASFLSFACCQQNTLSLGMEELKMLKVLIFNL